MPTSKILIAMKESEFRDELIEQAAHSGFEIIAVSNGLQAINTIKYRKINAVIIDYDLPQFDGIELILNIRDFSKNVPVLVVSDSDYQLRDEIMKAGATGVLNRLASSNKNIDLLLDTVLSHKSRLQK